MERERADALAAAFVAAAAAHHEATGGPDDDWAGWYARWLDIRLEPILGTHPGADRLATWLTEADRWHRANAPERPWAEVYAERVLRWTDGGVGGG